MWAILKISGKIPALNILLNICVKGKDNGVAIIETNLPRIPQCEEYDFLISRQNLATSMYEVLILLSGVVTLSFTGSSGTGSSAPVTVALDEKNMQPGAQILHCGQ